MANGFAALSPILVGEEGRGRAAQHSMYCRAFDATKKKSHLRVVSFYCIRHNAHPPTHPPTHAHARTRVCV